MADSKSKRVTLEELNDTFSQIRQLVEELRNKLYPNGKPDWMSQSDWDNISGEDTDCPIKLNEIHCPNCFFAPNGKCEYERIMRDEHTQVKEKTVS